MKHLHCLFLAVLIIFTLAVPAMAEEMDTAMPETEEVTPRLSTISMTSVTISINDSTGIASCDVLCYAKSNYTIEIVCKLQRKVGSTWTTLKTWSTTGTTLASLSEIWAVSRGYTYRAYATFYVYDSNGVLLETVSNSNSQAFY